MVGCDVVGDIVVGWYVGSATGVLLGASVAAVAALAGLPVEKSKTLPCSSVIVNAL